MAEEKKMTAEEAEAKLKAMEAELAAAKAALEEATEEEAAAEEPKKKTAKKAAKKADETTEAPKKKKTAKQKNLEKAVELRAEGKSATGLRIGAILLWVAALVCEIFAIRMFNLANETLAIVFIVADAVTCIIGSLLWKRSNKIDPPSKKNKLGFFLKTQLGLIACLICFIPLGILLLKNQDLSAKSKKLIAIIAAVCFVATAGASIDYAPVSAEEVAQAEAVAATAGNYDGSVYWTRWGKSYHFDSNCQSLQNTREENLFSGTLSEAMSEKRTDPCDFCAKGVEDIDPETLDTLLDSFGGSNLAEDEVAEELVEDVLETEAEDFVEEEAA